MILQILGQPDWQVVLVGLLIAWIFGTSIHEFAHAAAATWLGDSLPRREGRLTIQPAAHLDVMGSLMFLIGGFGWGKPVAFNPYALRTNPRTGAAIVAAAGPLSNFILATILAVPVRALPFLVNADMLPLGLAVLIGKLLTFIIYFNLILGCFNLIPVAPLDGFTILQGLLPADLAERLEITRRYGFFILFLLIFASNSLSDILYRPVFSILGWLVGTGI